MRGFLSCFTENNLISGNQLDNQVNKLGNSYINQLLSITHEIYLFLDDNREERGIFSDTSKAFNKVWQKRRIYNIMPDVDLGLLQHARWSAL